MVELRDAQLKGGDSFTHTLGGRCGLLSRQASMGSTCKGTEGSLHTFPSDISLSRTFFESLFLPLGHANG